MVGGVVGGVCPIGMAVCRHGGVGVGVGLGVGLGKDEFVQFTKLSYTSLSNCSASRNLMVKNAFVIVSLI